MRRISKLFLILQFSAISLFAADDLSKIILAGEAQWGLEHVSDWGWALYFNKTTNDASWQFIGEGSPSVKATYEIKGEQIIITSRPVMSDEYQIKFDKEINPKKAHQTICLLRDATKSLIYTKSLVCDNGYKLFNDAFARIGEELVIDGVPVITMGGKMARSTSALNFRSKPDIKARAYKCTFPLGPGGPDDPAKEYPYIIQDRRIFIIGRTKEKQIVQKWNNYWYYVQVLADPHSGEGCTKLTGWVFAEFVAIQ